MFPLFERIAATFTPGETAAAAADAAAPTAYHGGGAGGGVAVRLVDESPDAAARAREQRVTGPDGHVLWLAPGEVVTPAMFASAHTALDAAGHPAVDFTLTSEGRERLAAVTRQNIGKRLALLANGKVLWAPMVRDPITGGKGQISGRFTEAEAEALARDIAQPPVPGAEP
jgi:preprotein translocase subunit SecD